MKKYWGDTVCSECGKDIPYGIRRWCPKCNALKPKIDEGKLDIFEGLKSLQETCHSIAKKTGHWDTERNNGEMIALMHSELSEALESLRHNDWKNVAEEMADITIRVMDFCEARKINLGKAILNKMKKNQKRPYRHGKQF